MNRIDVAEAHPAAPSFCTSSLHPCLTYKVAKNWVSGICISGNRVIGEPLVRICKTFDPILHRIDVAEAHPAAPSFRTSSLHQWQKIGLVGYASVEISLLGDPLYEFVMVLTPLRIE